jgi:hypothetical protein
LTEIRWTEDLTVSGKIERPRGRIGEVRAWLHLAGADGLTGDLIALWPEGIADSRANIRGTLNGAAVHAQVPAP